MVPYNLLDIVCKRFPLTKFLAGIFSTTKHLSLSLFLSLRSDATVNVFAILIEVLLSYILGKLSFASTECLNEHDDCLISVSNVIFCFNNLILVAFSFCFSFFR